MRTNLLALALVMASGPVHAELTAPVVLKPSGKWIVDYAESRCRAVRMLGNEDERSVLILDQYAPSRQLIWTIAGPVIPNRSNVSIQFVPAYGPLKMARDGLTLGKFGHSTFGTGFEKPDAVFFDPGQRREKTEPDDDNQVLPAKLDVSEAARISWVAIESGTKREVRFALDNMVPLYTAMNACMSDLLVSWAMTRQPKPRSKSPSNF